MTKVRVLNSEGLAAFSKYLANVRLEPKSRPPFELLNDGVYSDPFDSDVDVNPVEFSDSFRLGEYICNVFAGSEDRLISRNHGLWSWLALYFFDQVCKPDGSGSRKVLEDAVYVLEEQFSFRRYYRHCIRTPWLAVKEHGEFAKILLLTSGRGTRTDINEQLGAYQHLFANKTLIESAYRMYFDPVQQKPLRGAGGKGGGSARRLASVTRQLELTYDIQECTPERFIQLLPKEFRKWA